MSEDFEEMEARLLEMQQALVRQVSRIANALEAAKDPDYEEGLRRTVPSAQPIHAARVPAVRRIARDWVREYQSAPTALAFDVCEVLWSTGWREERLVAIFIILFDRRLMDEIDWKQLERWAGEVDNWELVDQLAAISGRLLERNPRLLTPVRGLATRDNAWQRRFALVTLIVASRDEAWIPGLAGMIERLQHDTDPYVKKALTWARDTLKKRQEKLG